MISRLSKIIVDKKFMSFNSEVVTWVTLNFAYTSTSYQWSNFPLVCVWLRRVGWGGVVYNCERGPKVHMLSPGSQKFMRKGCFCLYIPATSLLFHYTKNSDEFLLIATAQHNNWKHVQCIEMFGLPISHSKILLSIKLCSF
jgi:hypothetical protein